MADQPANPTAPSPRIAGGRLIARSDVALAALRDFHEAIADFALAMGQNQEQWDEMKKMLGPHVGAVRRSLAMSAQSLDELRATLGLEDD